MKWCVLVVVVVLIAGTGISLQAASTPAKKYRLVLPWSRIESLTDEQREKIYHIHRKALDDMKAIKEQERKEILALLTDAQKIEMVEAEENRTVERKKETAASRTPTTAAAIVASTQRSPDVDVDLEAPAAP